MKLLNSIKALFSPRAACFSIYNKAKRARPGKPEADYLRIILLTKPPYDYQTDQLLDRVLRNAKNIEDLANIIGLRTMERELWITREQNLREYGDKFRARNQAFFEEFWAE